MKSVLVLFRNSAREPYIAVNISLAAVIFMIFLYSAIFSPEKNNYPVVCIHEQLTGKPCVSCGLSHSFSLAVRGKFNEAQSWNPYGIRIFSFFLIQLAMRLSLTAVYLKLQGSRRIIVLFDAIISSLLFLVAFYPFLKYIAESL